METLPPAVPMVHYVCRNAGSGDGAEIFDRKLLSALSDRMVAVTPLHPRRQRAVSLPFWQGRLPDISEITARLHGAKKEAAHIVLSHEHFFPIAHRMPVDMLIVHNYMPSFSFPSHKALEACYHLGSQSFMGRAFANAEAIIFLSYRDHSHAVADFPLIADRFHVLPPPPHRVALGADRDDVIHVSGSEDWLPKRLSRLTDNERMQISAAGFSIEDFGELPTPAFGLIPDRFTVGFKLKLMQMLYVGDAIASRSDIGEEIMALAPKYPWWCEVASINQALEWFSALRNDPAWHAYRKQRFQTHLPDWGELADHVKRILKFVD